jgi:hypothetical protein
MHKRRAAVQLVSAKAYFRAEPIAIRGYRYS